MVAGIIDKAPRIDPNNHNLVFVEIWLEEHPETIFFHHSQVYITKSKLIDLFDEAINFGPKIIDKNPDDKFVFSVQANLGKGVVVYYGYEDGGEAKPKNARTALIKPVYEEGVIINRPAKNPEDRSLVYHVGLDEKYLSEKLAKLGILIDDYYNGKSIDNFTIKKTSSYSEEYIDDSTLQ